MPTFRIKSRGRECSRESLGGLSESSVGARGGGIGAGVREGEEWVLRFVVEEEDVRWRKIGMVMRRERVFWW